MNKKMRSGIAVLLAGLTMCFASACGNEAAEKENLALQQRLEELLAASSENENTELEKEKLALQQRLEELQQQNSSMLAEKDSLQQQFDELKEQNQAVLDELKGLEDTIYGPPLESGFYYDIPKGAFGSPYAMDMVGLKSDRSRFDIDDVTLDFYIGAAYLDERYEEEYKKGFDIYFSGQYYRLSDSEPIKYFAKHVDEPFTKEHVYKITDKPAIEYDDFYRREVEMKKYYTVTVPKEVFNEEAGKIYINFCYFEPESEELSGKIFYSGGFYYKMEYGKVAISRERFSVWGPEV